MFVFETSKLIMSYEMKWIFRQYRTVEISERGKYKLNSAAEVAKQVLSIQNVAQCSCESIGGGYDFNCSISRPRFESLISPLIPEIIEPIMDVLKKSGLNSENIKKVCIAPDIHSFFFFIKNTH